MNLRKHWFLPALLIWGAIFGIYEVLERTVLVHAPPSSFHVLHILRGTITSFLLAAFVAGFMIRRGGLKEPAPRAEDLVDRGRWLIRLRWVAIAGVVTTIVAARVGFGLLGPATVLALSVIVGIMALYNVAFLVMMRRIHTPRAIAFAQIFLDLISLTLLLYYSGGITNPFFSFFVFHVIIAGILLRRGESYLIAGLASLLFCGMVALERAEIIGSHPLGIFPPLPGNYVFGILVAFVATTFFSTYFTTTIMADLRRATRDLGREKTKLDDIIQGIGAGLIVLDRDRAVVWTNDRARSWFGEIPIGAACYEALREASEVVAPASPRETVGGARPYSSELRLQGRHFLVTTTAVRDPDGEVSNILILVQETTAQKKLEEQLEQAGKMANLGGLASGIAHELNNPLATIAASADFLKEIAQDRNLEEPVPRYLSRIEEHVYRCKEIIESLLGFARQEETGVVPTDVNAAANEVQRLMGGRIDPELSLSEPAPVALANPRLVQHVMLNLLANARDAAGEGGSVGLATSLVNGEVRIAVTDAGPGIPPDDLPRIFEPFFTTKPVGRGTGLGLFLCHRMVEAMGGRIDVQSEPGAGTTFTVTLRRAEGDP